jgi:hypothetical protein
MRNKPASPFILGFGVTLTNGCYTGIQEAPDVDRQGAGL